MRYEDRSSGIQGKELGLVMKGCRVGYVYMQVDMGLSVSMHCTYCVVHSYAIHSYAMLCLIYILCACLIKSSLGGAISL